MLKEYRKRRDKGEFTGIGEITAYMWYMQNDKDNKLEDLLKLFGKSMVERAYYSGLFKTYNQEGFEVHLHDTDTWKKYT